MTPGRTKPTKGDIAMFDGFTEQQIVLFLAAGKAALRRKQAKKGAKVDPRTGDVHNRVSPPGTTP